MNQQNSYLSLGFLGSGRMAAALLEGVLQAQVFSPASVFITDRLAPVAQALAQRTGASALPGTRELAGAADVILLCVKPGDVPAALREAGGMGGKLLISIAAGVTLATLREHISGPARLVRVMPNTPALIGQGAAAYAAAGEATPADIELTERIFSAVGTVSRVKEEMLDAVTGLSGSGPAFIYTVIEALADGGVLMGLSRELAVQLAAQTVRGAAAMVLQTGMHPAQLRDQVTSPGGTTIAGLEVLESAGLRAALLAAVRAATERSIELGGSR